MTNIKELRQRRNITQLQLAQKLNIDRSVVAKWETGISSPRTDKLPQLAKALNCTIDELFTDTETA